MNLRLLMDPLDEIRAILKEITEKNKELQASQEKTDRQIDKLQASQEKTDRQIEKTSEKLEAIIEQYGGFIKNSSRETEEFFVRAIEKNGLQIGNYQFKFLDANLKRKKPKIGETEIDILLVNGSIAAVTEVKSTLHLNDVIKYRDVRLPKFRALFSEHRKKRLLGVVAGKVINQDALELAHDCGFVILSPEGQDIKVDDSFQRELDI